MARQLNVLDDRLAAINGSRCEPKCPHLYDVKGQVVCLAFAEYLRLQGGREKGPMRCAICRSCERLWGAEP